MHDAWCMILVSKTLIRSMLKWVESNSELGFVSVHVCRVSQDVPNGSQASVLKLPPKKDASIWIASAFATTQVLKNNSYFLCKFLSFPSQSFFPASQISSFIFSGTSDEKHKSNFPPVSLRCQAAFLRAFRIQPLQHHLSQPTPTVTVLGEEEATTPGNGRRLLVLGGNGFVGREVCRLAVQRGFAVTSLSRRGENPEPGNKELDQVIGLGWLGWLGWLLGAVGMWLFVSPKKWLAFQTDIRDSYIVKKTGSSGKLFFFPPRWSKLLR